MIWRASGGRAPSPLFAWVAEGLKCKEPLRGLKPRQPDRATKVRLRGTDHGYLIRFPSVPCLAVCHGEELVRPMTLMACS
jgi:hypothetical protein